MGEKTRQRDCVRLDLGWEVEADGELEKGDEVRASTKPAQNGQTGPLGRPPDVITGTSPRRPL